MLTIDELKAKIDESTGADPGSGDGLNEFYEYPDDYLIDGVKPEIIKDWCYGDGHEMGKVIKIGDQFWQVDGTYSSWDSSEWDDIYEVEVYVEPTTMYRVKK